MTTAPVIDDLDVLRERVRHLEAVLEVAHFYLHQMSPLAMMLDAPSFAGLTVLFCDASESIAGPGAASLKDEVDRQIDAAERALAGGQERSVKR